MVTVNKPILLDETGKDLASAIREQTTELKNAISAISVGGGSADGGYFPSNMGLVAGPDTSTPIVMLDPNFTLGHAFQIYNPATDDFPPPKYAIVYFMLDDGDRPTGFQFSFVNATAEEVSVMQGEEWELNVIASFECHSSPIGLRSEFIPLPCSSDKPLWLRVLDATLASEQISKYLDSIIIFYWY